MTRMMNAVEYIEDNIEEPFDSAKIARAALSSPYHFQRLFNMLAGCSLAEYVRRRKLTLAAQDLAASDVKVIDIAFKYSYESPESFSKAFRKVHGISPSAVRKPGAVLKAFPRISFHLSLKGDKDMDYRIVERKAFYVAGEARRFSTKDGENFKNIPKFWGEFKESGACERLQSNFGSKEMLGICMEMEQENEQITYMIGIEGKADFGSEFVTKEIPASTWAVFKSVGPVPAAIQKVWERIFQEWFPSTGFEHAGTAEFELYPDGNANAEDYVCEVWIPVVKK